MVAATIVAINGGHRSYGRREYFWRSSNQVSMDLKTENHLASLLMEEARRLRVQAEKEGIHAYLHKPNVRAHPNSRFLTATVLGVQQANRAVEVGEMLRAREKELELEAKLKSRARGTQKQHHGDSLQVRSSSRNEEACRNSATQSSSSKCVYVDHYSSDIDGLRDEEVEEFLNSRLKRGRGAIGSRMDETGPFMSSATSDCIKQQKDHSRLVCGPDMRLKEEWERRILGPDKPSFLKSDDGTQPDEPYNTKDVWTIKSSKKHHHHHRSKERRSKDGNDKKSKHQHKSRRRD